MIYFSKIWLCVTSHSCIFWVLDKFIAIKTLWAATTQYILYFWVILYTKLISFSRFELTMNRKKLTFCSFFCISILGNRLWLQFVQIWPKSWTGLDLKTLEANSFRIYHKYALGPPTITPDDSFTLSSLPDFVSIAHDLADSHSKASWWSSFGSSCLETVKN